MGRYGLDESPGNGGVVLYESGSIPAARMVEVLVAGGGTAGVIAAIAAARSGADTLLIERYGFLGGTVTAAFVNTPGNYYDVEGNLVAGGIPWEITRRIADAGAGSLPTPLLPSVAVDPEYYKFIAAEMVDAAGARQLLHTWVSDAIVIDHEVKGVVVENKSGRQAILARVVVDATGDGDVAARAGAVCEVGRPGDGLVASATTLFRLGNVDVDRVIAYMQEHPDDLILGENPHRPKRDLSQLDRRSRFCASGFFSLMRKAKENGDYAGRDRVVFTWMPYRGGEVVVNTADVPFANGSDADVLNEAESQGRRQVRALVRFFQKYVPGFSQSYLVDVAAQTGVRESRRVIGDYVLTQEDILESRRFDDAIGRGAHPVDYHLGGKSLHLFPRRYYGLPYRLMLPKGVEGLLVAGRCSSATHEAGAALRGELNCMVLGEAAGVAAALCVGDSFLPRSLAVSRLQDALRNQGVLI